MNESIRNQALGGAFEEALRELEGQVARALAERRFPELAKANLALAELYLALGDGESARKYLYRALEESSNSDPGTIAKANLLRARIECAGGNLPRARIYVDKASTSSAEALLVSAEIAHHAGDPGETRRMLKKIADPDPGVALQARRLEALCAAAEGDFASARELAAKARSEAQSSGWDDALWRAESLLGRLREEEGFFEEASKHYRAAREGVRRIAAKLAPDRAARYQGQTEVTALEDRLGFLDTLLANVAGQTKVRTDARRFKRLSAFMRRANAETQLDRLLAYLLETVMEECDGTRGRAVVQDREVTRHTARSPLGRDFLKATGVLVEKAIEKGRSVLQGQVLAVPLEGSRRVLGAMVVESSSMDESDMEFVQALADHAGTALANLLMAGEATIDPATGVSTHAHFERVLERELSRARRNGRHAGLMSVDVGLGARPQDAGAILSETLRNYDCVASRGAGAFELLVCDAGHAELAAVAGRLRARLQASVGGAVFPEDAASVAELLARAGEALAKAKAAGGNRYVACSSPAVADSDPFLMTRPGRIVAGMVSKLLREGGDVDAMLRQSLDLMAKAVDAERGLIFLLEEGGGMRAVLNMPDRKISLDADDYSTSVLRRTIQTGKPLRVADVGKDTWASGLQSVQEMGTTSLLTVPIISGTRVLGAVYLDTRRAGKTFTEEDQTLLSMFANVVARPIEQGAELKMRAAEVSRLQDVVRSGLSELGQRYQFGAIIGRSEPMRRVFELIERVAPSPYPVILEGETGAGKELVAKAIHFNSPRKQKPFLPVNCGAVAETLLESQLFGHIKGAFTGADQSRPGLFEAAHGGSLFLDEIEEMGDAMQKKLLRVLEESQVWPVGSREPVKVDVRIIAATNLEVKDLVEEGRFRQDLYYRLNTFTLRLPPLRERAEDIPLLVEHILDEIGKETKTPRITVSQEALGLMMKYSWPGNVRELRNELRKLSVLVRGEVKTTDLPVHVRESTGSLSGDFGLRDRLEEVDKKLILEALDRNDWNISRASEDLGINRNTLKTRMRKHGIRKTDR